MEIEQNNKPTETNEANTIQSQDAETQALAWPQNRSDKDKTLWEYFVLCLTDKYFCFSGRARRKEYWSFMLFHYLIGIIFAMISDFLAVNNGNLQGIEILRTMVMIALFIPGVAVLFRRLHDVNFSGLWITMPWLAVFGVAFLSGYHNAANDGYHVGVSVKFFAQNDTGLILTWLLAISLIMMMFIIVLTLCKSQMKTNKYGPIPDGVK